VLYGSTTAVEKGAGPDGEGDLGLLTVIDGQTLEHEASETGSGTTADGVVDQETLKTSAVVGQLTHTVEAQVHNLLSDGVVTTGEVVGRILLTGDQLLRVEQLTVGSGTHLIDDGGLQVHEHGTGHVLARTSLGEEGVEGIVSATNRLVGGHLPIRLGTMFQTEQLPTGVTDLDTGLTQVDSDNFTHCGLVFVYKCTKVFNKK